MPINSQHVDYANARTFLDIMKALAREVGWSHTDIERQERIVAECKAELEAVEGEV